MDIFTLNALVSKLKKEAEATQLLVRFQLLSAKDDVKRLKFFASLGTVTKAQAETIERLGKQLEELSIKLDDYIYFLSNPEAPKLIESAIRSKGYDPEKWIMEALDDPQKLADMVTRLTQDELFKRR